MARRVEREERPGGATYFGRSGWRNDPVGGRQMGPKPITRQGSVLAPPTSQPTGGVNPAPTGGGSPRDGGSAGLSGGVGGISAAESAARAQGKAKSRAENQGTQGILDALLGSIAGYEKGRDTQLANAQNALDRTLEGILANYSLAVDDYDESAKANAADYDAKTQANVTNRARERMSVLQQAASQGAGETDQLRAQVQAFLNANANQLEVDTARSDTERSILSQIANANSTAESQRRSAWAQNQEQRGAAMNEFYKNHMDTFTNAQRVAAQNTNVDTDFTEGFNADTKGYNLVEEASRFAGKTYQEEKKDDDFFRKFSGRRQGERQKVASNSRAAATTISAPRAAEGATLRGRN